MRERGTFLIGLTLRIKTSFSIFSITISTRPMTIMYGGNGQWVAWQCGTIGTLPSAVVAPEV